MASSKTMPLKSFGIKDFVNVPAQDELFKYNKDADARINREAPWRRDPHYFTSCKISAMALVKMVIHARSGVPYEIMGLMRGKVVEKSLVILDSFALPVQGTETRVNAGDQATEYMVQFLEGSKQAGMMENVVGWYHSHPGYGCWLSGIDVATERQNQQLQDPFVAVVVDPVRTISAGKVDIGAFRTFSEDYKPPNSAASDYQYIPQEKVEEFGVHANAYYPLEVSVFKSSTDDALLGILWNKYWANTLSSSPLISNRAYAAAQLADVHLKLKNAHNRSLTSRERISMNMRESLREVKENAAKGRDKDATVDTLKKDLPLAKAVLDSNRIASDAQHALISQVIKDVVFSRRLDQPPSSSEEQITESIMNISS